MVSVDLKPHIGLMGTAIGVVEVEFQQWMVFACVDNQPKRLVGYLGYHENAHIQPVVHLPDSTWHQIKVAAEKAKGGAISEVTQLSELRDSNGEE